MQYSLTAPVTDEENGMKLVDRDHSVTIGHLRAMAAGMFGDFVKAVVDIERGVMAVDAELHSDEEAFLIQNGSAQAALWGINIYPALEGPDFVEFDSMINLRPVHGNHSRGVEDPIMRARIAALVEELIIR